MASNVALMGVAGPDCYTAAKGGIAAITRSMAVEFAPQNVQVNAIAPAATMTDRVRGRCEAGNPRVTKIAAAANAVGLCCLLRRALGEATELREAPEEAQGLTTR